MKINWKRQAILLLVALPLISPIAAPQLLAFPYHSSAGGQQIWSEERLPERQLNAVLDHSTTLVAQSPLARPPERRHIFLTRGGWRWTWLALQNRSTLAISRGINDAIIINRSDLASDRMVNESRIARARTLSGIIAHETCHGTERRHFGADVDFTKPTWLREGYCDHVAQESGLSDEQAAALLARGESHRALVYCQGRRRVAAELQRNGGSVDALFATAGE